MIIISPNWITDFEIFSRFPRDYSFLERQDNWNWLSVDRKRAARENRSIWLLLLPAKSTTDNYYAGKTVDWYK